MKEKMLNCPGSEELENYCLQNLDAHRINEISEHMYTCDVCIEEARKIMNAVQSLQIVKANPLLGQAWVKSCDTVEEYMCADDANNKIIELETRNKNYRITLRPVDGSDNLSLLEIEVLKESISGYLVIYAKGLTERIEIDENGLACTVVKSDLDLNQLVIRSESY